MPDTFYSTTAQIAFTLLGLWWVIVEFKHREWMKNPSYRRLSYNISLYFILPGTMSLISLLANEAKFLWRIAFSIAGLLGLIETIYVLMTARTTHRLSWVVRLGWWGAAVLFALISVLATFPEVVPNLGIALKPIEVEAIMVALLVFLGVNFAWVLFTEPSNEAPRGEGQP